MHPSSSRPPRHSAPAQTAAPHAEQPGGGEGEMPASNHDVELQPLTPLDFGPAAAGGRSESVDIRGGAEPLLAASYSSSASSFMSSDEELHISSHGSRSKAARVPGSVDPSVRRDLRSPSQGGKHAGHKGRDRQARRRNVISSFNFDNDSSANQLDGYGFNAFGRATGGGGGGSSAESESEDQMTPSASYSNVGVWKGKHAAGSTSSSVSIATQDRFGNSTEALDSERIPSEEARTCYINRLPDDILIKIFTFLDPVQLWRVESCCSRWRKLISSDECWRQVFLRYYNISESMFDTFAGDSHAGVGHGTNKFGARSRQSSAEMIMNNGNHNHNHNNPDIRSAKVFDGYSIPKKICVNGSWREELASQRTYSRAFRKILSTAATTFNESDSDYDELFIFGLESWEKHQHKLNHDPDVDSMMSGRYAARYGGGFTAIQDVDPSRPSMSKVQRTHQSYDKKDPWSVMVRFPEASISVFEPFTKKRSATFSLLSSLPLSPITTIKKFENTTDLTNPLLITGFADGRATVTRNLLDFKGPKIVDFTKCHVNNTAIQQVAFVNNRTNDALAITAGADGLVFVYDTRTGMPLARLSTNLDDVYGVQREHRDRVFPGQFISLETIDYELERDDGTIIVATTIAAVKSTGIILIWKVEEEIKPCLTNNVKPQTLLPGDFQKLTTYKKHWVGSMRRIINSQTTRNDFNAANSDYMGFSPGNASVLTSPMPQTPNQSSNLFGSSMPYSPQITGQNGSPNTDSSNLDQDSTSLLIQDSPELSASFYFDYSNGSSNNVFNLIGSDMGFLVSNSRIYLIYFDNWLEYGITSVVNRRNITNARRFKEMIIGGVLAMTPTLHPSQLITCCSWERRRRQVHLISSDGKANSKIERSKIRSGLSTPPVVITCKRVSISTLVTGHINGTFTVWELPNGIPGSLALEDYIAERGEKRERSKLSKDISMEFNTEQEEEEEDLETKLDEIKDELINPYGIQYQLLSDFVLVKPRMVSSQPLIHSLVTAGLSSPPMSPNHNETSNFSYLSASPSSPTTHRYDMNFGDQSISNSYDENRSNASLSSTPRKRSAFLPRSHFYDDHNSKSRIVKLEHKAASLTATVCGNLAPVVSCFVDNFKIVVSHLDGDVSVWRLVDGMLLSRMAKSGRRYRSASAFNAQRERGQNELQQRQQNMFDQFAGVPNNGHQFGGGRTGGGLGDDHTIARWDESNTLGPWATSSATLRVLQNMTSIPVPMRCISADENTIYGLRDKSAVRVVFGKSMTKSAKRFIEREMEKNRMLLVPGDMNSVGGPSASSSTASSATSVRDPGQATRSSTSSASSIASALDPSTVVTEDQQQPPTADTQQQPQRVQFTLPSVSGALGGAGGGMLNSTYGRHIIGLGGNIGFGSGSGSGHGGNTAAQEFHLQRQRQYDIKQAISMREEEDYKERLNERSEEKMLKKYNGNKFDGLEGLSDEELVQYITMLNMEDNNKANDVDDMFQKQAVGTASSLGGTTVGDESSSLSFYLKQEQQRSSNSILSQNDSPVEKPKTSDETQFPSLGGAVSAPTPVNETKTVKKKPVWGAKAAQQTSTVAEDISTKVSPPETKGKSHNNQSSGGKGKKQKRVVLDLGILHASAEANATPKEQEDLDYAIALSLQESLNANDKYK